MVKLLLVFIHGFRGSETSFKEFPTRLKTVLGEMYTNVDMESVVYPRYETSGDLKLAVEKFCTWLSAEANQRLGSNSMIVLLSHSMGGIVAAESILRFHRGQGQETLHGAEIIGLLAFDTPFYSVNHKYVSTQAVRGVQQVNDIAGRFLGGTAATAVAATSASKTLTAPAAKPSGSSSRWGLIAGVAAVAAVGTAAYLTRNTISAAATSAYSELEFVSVLMDGKSCHERVQQLNNVPNVLFRCFYVQLPNLQRTFITLPPEDTSHLFIPVPSNAQSEVVAHTSMFDPTKNDHYYTLGADSISLISEMVARFQRRQG